MRTCKTWSTQSSVFGPLLFRIYINDFSTTICKLANPILFADEASIIISNSVPVEFKNNINAIITETSNWFQGNLLTLNYDHSFIHLFISFHPQRLQAPGIWILSVYITIIKFRK